MKLKSLMGLLFLIFSFHSWAEYRVYQYLVRNTVKTPDTKDAHMITSSLDPMSFKAYHGGGRLVQVDLLRTWICPGYTGERAQYCPSPYDKLLE